MSTTTIKRSPLHSWHESHCDNWCQLGGTSLPRHFTSSAEERAAINMPIQGTAADLIKIAMINIHKRINSENYKSKMILQIHDELLFECPEDEVHKFGEMVQHEMETAISLAVPLKVDWNYGTNWYEAH